MLPEILNLPDHLLSLLVFDQLDFTDLIALDTAIADRTRRSQWLEVLKIAKISVDKRYLLSDNVPPWLSLRNVQLTTVHLEVGENHCGNLPLLVDLFNRAESILLHFHANSELCALTEDNLPNYCWSKVKVVSISPSSVIPTVHPYSITDEQVGELAALFTAHCTHLKEVSVQGIEVDINPLLEALVPLAPQLSSLVLFGSPHLDAHMLNALLRSAPHLGTLKVNNCGPVSTSTLQTIAEHCSSLQNVAFGSCPTGTTLAVCLPSWQHLTRLAVAVCFVVPALMQGLTAHCPQLQHFTVLGLVGKIGTVEALQLLSREVALSLLVTERMVDTLLHSPVTPQLQTVHLWLTDEHVQSVVQLLGERCGRLQSCTLYAEAMEKSNSALNTALITLAQRNPGLQHLALKSFNNVTNETLKVVATLCPHLETLELRAMTGITEGAVSHIVRTCRLLATLDVPNYTLTVADMLTIAEHGHNLKKLICGGIKHPSIVIFGATSSYSATAKNKPFLTMIQRCRKLQIVQGCTWRGQDQTWLAVQNIRPYFSCYIGERATGDKRRQEGLYTVMFA